MPKQQIQDWLIYWQAAKMVNINKIDSLPAMYSARRFCRCMRVGVFINVTDKQMWDALCDLRERVAA